MKKIIYKIICCLAFVGISFNIKAADSLLTTPDDHSRFIRSSLKSAKERVIIVSPFISSWVLNDNNYNSQDGLAGHIKAALARGVEISVYIDDKVDSKPATAKSTLEGRKILTDLDVGLVIVSKLHSKNLIVDHNCITFGSFNWLSASTTADFCNYETTTIIRNEQAHPAINIVLEGLSKLQVSDLKGIPDFAIVKMISDDNQLEEVLQLYRTTKLSYLRGACVNALGEHLAFCGDTKTQLYILRQTADVDAEYFSYFVDNALTSLVEDCEEEEDYEKLAQFFTNLNKKEVLPKIEAYKKKLEKMFAKLNM